MNIPQLLGEALSQGASSYKNEPRAPGFHASSSGKCYRQLLVEVMNPDYMAVQIDMQAKRRFLLGHLVHDIVHSFLEKRIWSEGGSILHVNPMQIRAFQDPSTGFEVLGTPDEVLLDLEELKLIIIDAKTANERSFAWKVQSGEASQMNCLQVGTYFAGLDTVIQSSGFGRAMSLVRHAYSRAGSDLPFEPDDVPPMELSYEGYIWYLEKNDLLDYAPGIGSRHLIGEAATYWVKGVKPLWLAAKKHGLMPGADPMEKWQCGYCPLFEEPPYKSPEAKRKHRLAACERTDGRDLLPAVKLNDTPVSTREELVNQWLGQ